MSKSVSKFLLRKLEKEEQLKYKVSSKKNNKN